MRTIAAVIFSLVLRFGGVGLLVLGILDSSFLFAPWGNDLLLVALTARRHSTGLMFYYSAMSALGSVLGSLVVDLVMRPLGAEGLQKYLSERRVKRIRARMDKKAGKALVLASLAPPPFPFTPVVMAAAALQYPRRRMLFLVGATRMVRYILVGFLALRFGTRILSWAKNSIVQGVLIGLIVVCLVGSVISIYGWIKASRSPRSDAVKQ